MYKRTGYKWLLFIFAVLPGLGACDSTFEPIDQKNRYFYSIYGALDATADTQWVRVMPIRDTLFMHPGKRIEAEITLTRASSGERIQLNDSLFSFFHWYDTDNRIHAWNFWKEYGIQYDESYTFDVASENTDQVSSVSVTVPPDFPTPTVEVSEDDPHSGTIRGSGVEHLAVVDVIYYGRRIFILDSDSTYGESFVYPVSYRSWADFNPNGEFEVANTSSSIVIAEFTAPGMSAVIDSAEVFMVSSSPDWPEYGTVEEADLYKDGFGNVEGGLGLLVGIVSKKIPFKSCYDENENLVGCPLIRDY